MKDTTQHKRAINTMTTVHIFRNSEQIDSLSIKNEFYIVKHQSGEIYWFERSETAPYQTGVYQIWLQRVAYKPRILFVPPDWQIIIDNLYLEKKFYQNIEKLVGKVVELQYKELRFVFQFDW